MIRIHPDQREIVFSREGAPPRRFPLISGHACPECSTVIRAVFETSEPVPVHMYEDPPAASAEKSRYDVARREGVQILTLGWRARMARRVGVLARSCCRYVGYTKPTLAACLAEILREELGISVWADQVDSTRTREVPGLRFVADCMGVAEPVVLFDRSTFIEAHSPKVGDGDPPLRDVWRERLAEACGFLGDYVADNTEET